MDFVLHNLRLKELVAIVQENRKFYEDFVGFLRGEGYESVLGFIQEPSDDKAANTISKYLTRPNDVKLYDGLLRPYANSTAKWFFWPGFSVMQQPNALNLFSKLCRVKGSSNGKPTY